MHINNFCIIASSGLTCLIVGNYSQILAFNFIYGLGDVLLGDFFTTAPYVRIFELSDGYSGTHLANVTLPRELLDTVTTPVVIGRHVLIDTGSVILPGVRLAEYGRGYTL